MDEHGAAGPGRLVTPEAVPLDLDLASVGPRAVGAILDFLLELVVLLLLALLVFGVLVSGALPGAAVVGIWLLLYVAVFWGYPIAMETAWRGRTLGLAATGLRVVTVDGAPIRFRHAAIRAALQLVDFHLPILPGVPAVLSSLLSSRNQRLGDVVAGTVVVRERTGAGRAQPVFFTVPYGLEGYAETVDVTGLSTADYAAVRRFLLRSPALPGQVRLELAASLAATVAGRLGHVPPTGTHPEAFLVIVAAKVQARTAPVAQPPAHVDPWAQPPPAPEPWVQPAPRSDQPPIAPPPTPGGFVTPG